MTATAALGCLTVAGCGGGGSSGGGGSNGGASNDSFASLVNENRAFFQKYNSDGSLEDDITPAASMPRSGTANYRGSAMIWAGEDISAEMENPNIADVDAAARMRMTANLGAGTVKGTIGDFKPAPGAPKVSGQVNFDGTIRGSSFRADSRGNVSVGNSGPMATSGSLVGVFVGPKAEGMTGYGAGNMGATQEYFILYSGQKQK